MNSQNQNQELVSIVIPAYNAEKYIAESIESCCRQTYRNIEIIVVNDGSEDQTSANARKCGEKDSRIRIIDLEHKGKVPALNAGVQAARGKYIAIHAADDVCFPYRISEELRVIKQEDAVLVFGDLEVVDEGLEVIASSFWRREGIKIKKEKQLENLLLSNFVSGGTILFDVKIVRKVFPMPPSLLFEDWWIALVASFYGKIAFTERPLIKYRLHTSNDNLVTAEVGLKTYVAKQKRLIGRNLEYYRQFQLFISKIESSDTGKNIDFQFLNYLIHFGSLFVKLSLDNSLFSRLKSLPQFKFTYIVRIQFHYHIKMLIALALGETKYRVKYYLMKLRYPMI